MSKQLVVKYKQVESINLKKAAGELTSDMDSANAELSVVVRYLVQLNEMCVAKAETNGERDSWVEGSFDDSLPEFDPAEHHASARRH